MGSRQTFARLLSQGWTDAMRKLRPAGPFWTFWDYKFERWEKDKGMRLDHFLSAVSTVRGSGWAVLKSRLGPIPYRERY